MSFIDVDFPELMKKKCDIITTTDLCETIGPFQRYTVDEGTHLRSSKYIALGCDLTDIEKVQKLVSNEVDLSSSLILCIAEVSITYMMTETADALIAWAAQHEDSALPLMSDHHPVAVLNNCSTILSP